MMGRGGRIATLLFSTNKHCFITLPEDWSKELRSSQEIRVFEIQWGEKRKAFFSWNGDFAVATSPLTSTPVVQINGLLADKAGLKHGQEVILQEQPYTLACQRVHVEPASIDDWEILELHASQIEERLLDQVRVIWSGMILPVWVDKKICIFLKIISTEPSGNCVRLEPNTELFVSPQSRSQKQSGGLLDFMPHPRVNELSASETGSSKSTNSESLVSSSASGYISDFDSALSVDSFEWRRKNRAQSPSVSDDNGTVISAMPWEVDTTTILREIPIVYRVWDAVTSALVFRRSVSDRSLLDTQEDARRKLVQEFWREVKIVSRVEPLFTKKLEAKERKYFGQDSTNSTIDTQPGLTDITPHGWAGALSPRLSEGYHNLESTQVTFSMLMQPTTVYLSSSGGSDVLSRYAEELDQDNGSEYVNFLAYMTKLSSPSLNTFLMKGTLAASSPKSREKNEKTPSQEGTDSSGERPLVVRVVIHGNELKGHCRKEDNNLYASMVFEEKPVEWFVQVPDLLRRQKGLELTSRVMLHPVTHPPMPVQYLILYPLLEKPLEESVILQGFKHWLGCVSCMISPMPVQQHGNLIKFPVCTVKGFVYIEVLLSVNQLERYEDKSPYFLLHPFVLNHASVSIAPNVTATSKIPGIHKLPYWSIDDVDKTLKCPKLQDIGGVSDLGKCAIDHLSASMLARPLSQSLFASSPGLCHGGVLLCGSKGSGKTTVAKAICRELSEWPYLAHVKTVDCKHLQGKRIESIQNILQDALEEAAWRQPSVILLDDLDHIASAPRELEIGPEVVYHGRISQCLKDLISSEVYSTSRIGILATCQQKSNLHSTLVTSRGNHIFQVTLQIPPPTQEVRSEVLVSILQNRVEVDQQSLSKVDIPQITSRMDGFVPRDIHAVVERAIHASSCRMLQGRISPPKVIPAQKDDDDDDKIPEILLCQEDFHVALNKYTPTALRDVPLHSAGELGWDDIGGLKQVKQDLIETLLLPAKYPELFTNCPLRLRSGLLLYGPPGTGKTLLGSVVAKECGLNFISIKGPELLSKYIGASEQAVRDLFMRAQSARPCILFFDEFDSLAPRRGHDNTGVTDRVVNQLLTQLDGVEGLEGVYVIGATSRPDLLDPALLRPGRLDKCLYCPIPNLEERIEIIGALSRNIAVSEDVDLTSVIQDCDYFTGADIKALLYNAQLESIHSIMPRNSNEEDTDSELSTPIQIMQARNMEADDWKLTFLSADSDYLRDSRYRRISLDVGSSNSSPVSRRRLRRESLDAGRLPKLVPSSTFPPSTGSSESPDDQNSTESGARQTSLLPHLQVDRSGRKKHIPHISEFVRDTLENEETPSLPDNFQDSGVFSTGLSPDPSNNPPIFMPSLRDGVIELKGENLDKLTAEVDTITANYFKQKRTVDLEEQLGSQEDQSADAAKKEPSIMITQAHLMAAKRTMKPSVSAVEREKYSRIYQAFVESRGGDFKTKEGSSQKRATLA